MLHHLIVLLSTLEETSLFILKIQIYMQKARLTVCLLVIEIRIYIKVYGEG